MSKTLKLDSEIELYFAYGIDIKTKTLYMGSEDDLEGSESGVDYQMADRVLKGLGILDPIGGLEKGLTIVMNNVGGCEYHGMAIYDKIKACKSQVTIEVYGHAMSMGSIILQAADVRKISKNSRIMLHYGTVDVDPDAHAFNTYKLVDEYKAFDRMMEDVFLEKIQAKVGKYSRQQLRKKMTFDWYIWAEEALDWGLVDEIIPYEE